MAENGTERAGLPMALEAPRPRPSLKRSEITASFVSQLLAERSRTRRCSTNESAIGAYASGATIAVKRMPMGYRTSIVV